jgi:hypothetical protein
MRWLLAVAAAQAALAVAGLAGSGRSGRSPGGVPAPGMAADDAQARPNAPRSLTRR